MSEDKFPSEVIDLPSKGKLYPKEHPCSDGKIEIKYMTAKEEDILTSQNLIKKGVVIDRLLDSLILTNGVKTDDMLLGDKNAIMVAARILAYGPEYTCRVANPNTNETKNHTFNLTDWPFKKLPDGVTENKFKVTLPISKKEIVYKILTGDDELNIEKELKSQKKTGSQVSPELTTRLRYLITSIDGDDSKSTVNNFVQNMLARDSLFFRNAIAKAQCDIELKQKIEFGGEVVEVEIPLTTEFFWPST